MESQEEPTTVCENCEKSIAESKFFLHEAYCFRNIIRCSKCNEPINKNEVDAHDNEVHRLAPCRHCRQDFEVNALAQHVQNCTHKPKMCYFCNCEISHHEFDDHAYQCGSRTRKCTYCNKNILVRELEDHEAVCAVEQLTRETSGPSAADDSKEELLEDILSKPKNKQREDNRLIFKKNLEALKKENQKKKLTKLIDKKAPEKSQEELDEELAQELNREFYEGGRAARHRQNKKLVIDDNDEEEYYGENDLIEEKPKEQTRKDFKSKQIERRNTRQPERAQPPMESKTLLEKQLDDEFFGFKKNTRSTKMEIEKEDNESIARRVQAQHDREPQRAKLRRNNTQPNRAKTSYYQQEEAVEEEEYFPEQTNDTSQDPEFAQYMDEDAEMQRAIQASLEQQ